MPTSPGFQDTEPSSEDENKITIGGRDKLLKSWTDSKTFIERCWETWETEYLLSLRERKQIDHRTGRLINRNLPQLAEVVIIHAEMKPRPLWRLGIIKKLIKGTDGSIRSAELYCAPNKLVSRPLNLLYSLEVQDDDARLTRRRHEESQMETDKEPTSRHNKAQQQENYYQDLVTRSRSRTLKTGSTSVSKTDGNLPQKLERSYAKFNPNERNIRGETLIISVIRYEPDKATQIRQMNTLIRSGCDVSLPDSKQLRTPLMVACLMRNDAIAHHLINNNANLLVADKKGNTALMYAAVYSRSSLLSHLCEQLVKRWALEAFLAKNFMGYTAEGLARKNERYMYSMMLKKQRLRIVKLLRDFVTSNLKYAPEFKSWQQFVSVYKVPFHMRPSFI
ncbi:unnamed protein product [Anisakis simplex]|uniref:ANK_REP_REGION domain-containing protein n=1 Tax=Anisakis simplex TaxID=6269 RepID=A0A0M3K1U2_ANISI|nr:unnamed protein product [Anisakis simplex]